ncbi:MAG: helix-turn-helix domain-containing protein [Pseudonocardia sp.]
MSPDSPWLSPRTAAEVELNPDLLTEVLREYRKAHGINQADLAQLLNLDQSYISKIETGQRRVRDIEMLLRIAHQLDISPNRLGISNELLRPVAPPVTAALVGAVDSVESSQAEWRSGRRHLNRTRGALARTAAELYRADVRLGEVPFMAHRAWIPRSPIRLENVTLEWTDEAVGVSVTGDEPEAARMLPLRAPGQRFNRYTAAIRYLDPPTLFENRPSYRLLDVDLAASSGRLLFGLGTYFDKLDLSEAVAHELALADDTDAGSIQPWSQLPLRALVGDPFDLRRRFVMPAIETLTLRRHRLTGKTTFLLHWRDPAKVATAAGIYGLIPAGEFQSSSIASRDRENDFDLWRNIVREYSEEILGEPERDGSSGQPLDYDSWQLYRTLQQARDAGRVSAFCLGVGLDALTLTATILTVAVFDDDVFDDLFDCAVQFNAEGVLITAAESSTVSEGLPFTSETVHWLLQNEPMASPGACILDRAWRFRDEILTR